MHGCHYFYQGQLESKVRPGFQKNLKSKTYQVLFKAIVISEAHFVNKVTLFARSNAIGCIILIGGRGGRRIIAYICFISVQ